MNPNNYNPKAREAFGKTLIDIGVSIFKGTMLLFTVIPITLILKDAIGSQSNEVSVLQLFGAMSGSTYLTLVLFLVISFIAGHLFRKEGLRHIHESEDRQT